MESPETYITQSSVVADGQGLATVALSFDSPGTYVVVATGPGTGAEDSVIGIASVEVVDDLGVAGNEGSGESDNGAGLAATGSNGAGIIAGIGVVVLLTGVGLAIGARRRADSGS